MFRTAIRALLSLAALGLALASASSAWAQNSAIVNLSRLDDFVFPAAAFGMDVSVELLDEVGVTAVTLQAAALALTFEEFPPGGGEWEQVEEVTFSNLAALESALDGTWTLTIAGTSPSTSTFTLDAASLVDGNFFQTPTNLAPANGATGVSPTTLLTWTDPTGMATPYALAADVESDSQDQEVLSIPDIGVMEIPITATSWQPPVALENGPVEFAVFYADADLPVLTAISALQVTSGSITWSSSGFSPPGYPAETPFLVLGSESIVQFTVPEPSAASLAAASLLALAALARGQRRILRQRRGA